MNPGLVLLIVTAVAFLALALVQRSVRIRAKTRDNGVSPRALFAVQCILSLIVVGVWVYVIVTKNTDEATLRYLYGVIGVVVGFWFKTAVPAG